MARIYGIKKRLPEHGVDTDTAKEITGTDDLVHAIKQMEKLLDPGVTRQILDACACSGGKDYLKKCEAMGKELAGKSLSEKISHINSMGSGSELVAFGEDNTLEASLRYKSAENDGYNCVCSAAVKKGMKVSDLAAKNPSNENVMPLTYCYCCAGSFRRHLQLQLGVNLNTKEIISSPINSAGEKPCEFIFEIAE